MLWLPSVAQADYSKSREQGKNPTLVTRDDEFGSSSCHPEQLIGCYSVQDGVIDDQRLVNYNEDW